MSAGTQTAATARTGGSARPAPRSVALCRRLDNLALALELAAARLSLLDLPMLLARLERTLPLLVGGARDAPERQQTLRATVAWSYDLLDFQPRQLLARVSVFAGSFSLESAEAVCGADLDGLQALVDLNLLTTAVDS